MAPPSSESLQTIRTHLLVGLSLVGVLFFGAGGWAAVTSISGAVIAQGHLVVDSHVKVVQHPSGGVVGDILVKDGAVVEAGQLLVRMDDTQTRASLAIIVKRLDELEARFCRLSAERDNATEITFSPTLLSRSDDQDVADILSGEYRLFMARKSTRDGQKARLREQVTQLKEEIGGLQAQILGKKKEIDLISKELTGVRKLWAEGLVPVTRLHELERDKARLEGEQGALVFSVAETRGRISETELQGLQIDDELQSDVAQEIRDVQGERGEFVERRVSAQDQLAQVEIRAPQDGVVKDLAVYAPGAVLGAGEPVMEIVPVSDDLTVEARVSPQDIDQVQYGQTVMLRFSAFNRRTTPELAGMVTRIAADISIDKDLEQPFYLVRANITQKERDRLNGLQLTPGMPVEVFIQTQDRTVLSYLVKPIADQMSRAFKED